MAHWSVIAHFLLSYLALSYVNLSNARDTNLGYSLPSFNNRGDESTVPKVNNLNGNAGGIIRSGEIAEGNGEVVAQKSFPIIAKEPSCEQLRAMWIFSKRQSRAAEMTNEIPTFRDPFAYNIWEPYFPNIRNVGFRSPGIPTFNDRSRLPVFGKIVNREPVFPQRINYSPRKIVTNGEAANPRFYGTETKTIMPSTRRPSQNRNIGGSKESSTFLNTGSNTDPGSIQGSFQKLKELIWTERAKELTQQRKAEELAAKAAVLKEIASGQSMQPVISSAAYISDSPFMDVNRSPDTDDNNFVDVIPHNEGQSTQIAKNLNSKYSGSFGYGRLNFDKNHRKYSSKDLTDTSSIENIKMFPMRPSHFRERNRVLFKQPTAAELFHRYSRADIINSELIHINDRVKILGKSSNKKWSGLMKINNFE